jgi:chloramphenicol O-acetyltransferase
MVEQSATIEELVAKLPEEWRETVLQIVDLKVKEQFAKFEDKYKQQLEQTQKSSAARPATGRV